MESIINWGICNLWGYKKNKGIKRYKEQITDNDLAFLNKFNSGIKFFRGIRGDIVYLIFEFNQEDCNSLIFFTFSVDFSKTDQ